MLSRVELEEMVEAATRSWRFIMLSMICEKGRSEARKGS
jgi:hypothetical protein